MKVISKNQVHASLCVPCLTKYTIQGIIHKKDTTDCTIENIITSSGDTIPDEMIPQKSIDTQPVVMVVLWKTREQMIACNFPSRPIEWFHKTYVFHSLAKYV